MHSAKEFERILDCEVKLDRTLAIPQGVQSILSNFKRRVETPAGVKRFFETCSEVNAIVQDGTIIIFDIVYHDEHFMYHLGDEGTHKIVFYNNDVIVVDQFMKDEYFHQFLIMLSEACKCYVLQERM